MDKTNAWLSKLILKIKIFTLAYLALLVVCLILTLVFYFVSPIVSLSSETLTTNGTYLLQYSPFQEVEDFLFGNIKSVLTTMRQGVVGSGVFRAAAIMVAILATVLMGFTMMIGEQKMTLKEFFVDILIIFGTTSILLSSDPDKYIMLFFNFIQSISDFISKMLFTTTSGFMKIQYSDGTMVGPYAPLDAVASIFLDPVIAYRVKIKLTTLMLSPAFLYVPFVVIVLTYYLIPCILNVFIAILLAKVTIIFALQFLPFFLLFSSINDVKIKINKKAKGLNFTMKLINQGILQPMLLLSIISFVAGLLFYILVIPYIDDIFHFAVSTKALFDMPAEWWIACLALAMIPLLIQLSYLLPDVLVPVDLNYGDYMKGPILLLIGIVVFKKLFEQVTPAITSLVSVGGASSAASDIFTKGGGIFTATEKNGKTNDVASLSAQLFQGNADYATDKLLQSGFGYDNKDKLFGQSDDEDSKSTGLFNTDAAKSDMSKGFITNPFGIYKKDDKKDDAK